MHISGTKSALKQARQYWALEPVFIDTETTGLGPWSEVIEISVVDWQGNTLVDTLIRPSQTIPESVIWVHGITNDMVRQSPTWDEAWPTIQASLSGRYIGIYNAEFDLRLMRQSHEQYGLAWDVDEQRCFCIMKLYAHFHSQGRWQKLEAAVHQCGLTITHAHRAHADALAARGVMEYMAKLG
jgi:DNA polymerase III subunit epsilon